MQYREEIMSDELKKFVLNFEEEVKAPFDIIVHQFTGRDTGKPHDHPFSFRSFIAKGGYIERVYIIDEETKTFRTETIHRKEGDVFDVKATHIHEIVELPQGICYTVFIPQKKERDWGHWRFSDNDIEFSEGGEHNFKSIK